jgi:hypothetical protein
MSRLQQPNGSRARATRSIDDVAREQGITSPQDLDQIVGSAADLWESDQEFRSFVDGIATRRREGLVRELRERTGESKR